MLKVSIKGESWKFYIFDAEEYHSKFGDETSGFADVKRRQVFFNAEDLDMELVRHEMFHVYSSYLCLEAAKLSHDQMEEIYSELFAKDGTKMIAKSTEIFNKLRGME